MAKVVFPIEDFPRLVSVKDVNDKLNGLTLDNGRISALVKGDIIAFQTEHTPIIKGFIKVVKVKGTIFSSDYIELEIITNQPAENK